MRKFKSLKNRKREKAEEMYTVLNDFRRVLFVEGGDLDKIMEVGERALRLVRIIDNPILDKSIN